VPRPERDIATDEEVARRISLAESIIGIRFDDVGLITQALTHPSFSNRRADAHVYERLEFLGDAILGFVMADFIYGGYPDFDEGAMAELRAALVSGRTLADLAESLGLGEAVLMDRGVETAGGRRLHSVLADCFEAIVGAVYLDQGIDTARRFILGVYTTRLDPETLAGHVKDYKSQLQEVVQAAGQPTPVYRTVAESGPAHDRVFTVEVVVGDEATGRGTGRSKKEAERAAAEDALRHLA
jgi:ribonuclease III